MNNLSKIILMILFCGIATSVFGAAYNWHPQNIPEDSAFRKTSSGFAVALKLETREEKDGTKSHFIEAFLRNTTQANLYVIAYEGVAQVQIHYVDSSRGEVPLRNYQYDNRVVESNPNPFPVPPGYTFSTDIRLTESEWKLVQSRPVIFSLNTAGPHSTLIKVISPPVNFKETP